MKTTVIIPTYGGHSFLRAAVTSLWNQTLLPGEVVIVDDCSRDQTVALAEELARQSPVPTFIHRLPVNSGGPARPINFGLSVAQFPLIAVLDQDDTFMQDRIEQHTAFLMRHPKVNCVFGWSARAGSTESDLVQPAPLRDELLEAAQTDTDYPEFKTLKPSDALKFLLLRCNFTMGFPGFTFRKSVSNLQVDESLKIAGDYKLLCQLAISNGLGIVDRPAYRRLEHDANATRNQLRTNIECAQIRAFYLRSQHVTKVEEYNELRDWFLTLAYWTREAGYPLQSAWVYFSLLSIWGWDLRVVSQLFKVFPVHAAKSLLGVPRKKTAWTTTK